MNTHALAMQATLPERFCQCPPQAPAVRSFYLRGRATRMTAPIKPLEYETTPNGVTRRQMSLLLLLVAVDSIVLIVFVSLPTLGPIIRQTWTDYQRRGEQRRIEA